MMLPDDLQAIADRIERLYFSGQDGAAAELRELVSALGYDAAGRIVAALRGSGDPYVARYVVQRRLYPRQGKLGGLYRVEVQDRRRFGGPWVVFVRRGAADSGVAVGADRHSLKAAIGYARAEVRLRRKAGQFK